MTDLGSLKAGDRVDRWFSDRGPAMTLTVTEVDDALVHCGPWHFDRASGAEVDEDLGWGPASGVTGSYITPATPRPR